MTLDCCRPKSKPKARNPVKKTVPPRVAPVELEPVWEEEEEVEKDGWEKWPEAPFAVTHHDPARKVAGRRYPMGRGREKDAKVQEREEEDDTPERLGILAGYTYSQKLAEQAHMQDQKKSFEEMVPPQYQEFAKVFSKEASDRMPSHKPYDHAIDLKPEAELSRTKAYPMSPVEQEELNKFIQENLAKGYIRPSILLVGYLILFIPKKNSKL